MLLLTAGVRDLFPQMLSLTINWASSHSLKFRQPDRKKKEVTYLFEKGSDSITAASNFCMVSNNSVFKCHFLI